MNIEEKVNLTTIPETDPAVSVGDVDNLILLLSVRFVGLIFKRIVTCFY